MCAGMDVVCVCVCVCVCIWQHKTIGKIHQTHQYDHNFTNRALA